MAPHPIHILRRAGTGSSSSGLYIAGFVVAGVVLVGAAAWLTLRFLRKRARRDADDKRGAAFLNVRGLFREDGEKSREDALPEYGCNFFSVCRTTFNPLFLFSNLQRHTRLPGQYVLKVTRRRPRSCYAQSRAHQVESYQTGNCRPSYQRGQPSPSIRPLLLRPPSRKRSTSRETILDDLCPYRLSTLLPKCEFPQQPVLDCLLHLLLLSVQPTKGPSNFRPCSPRRTRRFGRRKADGHAEL